MRLLSKCGSMKIERGYIERQPVGNDFFILTPHFQFRNQVRDLVTLRHEAVRIILYIHPDIDTLTR
jgi:hypothetical protein